MSLLDEYLKTRIALRSLGGDLVEIRPAGALKATPSAGWIEEMLGLPGEEIYILTAWNPFSRGDVPLAENQIANTELARRLDAMSHPIEVLHAVGASHDLAWQEQSFAIIPRRVGLLADEILALALEFDQNAFFKVDAEGLHLIPAHMPEALGTVSFSVHANVAPGYTFAE